MAVLMNKTDVFAREIRLLILWHKNTEGKRIASVLGEKKWNFIIHFVRSLTLFSHSQTRKY